MTFQEMPRVMNTVVTFLTEGINATATTIPVNDISVFPVGPNFATLGIDDDAEVVMYAGTSSAALTGCLRGQSGTLAKTWQAGIDIYHAWTAEVANRIMNNLDLVPDEVDRIDTELSRLDQQKVDIAATRPQTWNVPNYNEGFPASSLAYTKNEMADVTLAGYINSSISIDDGTVAFTLPSGFRPGRRCYVGVVKAISLTPVLAYIEPNGNFTFNSPSAAGSFAIQTIKYTAEN